MHRQLKWKSIAKGIATYVPLVDELANGGAGAPVDAKYFYSVWLRHLVCAKTTVGSLSIKTVGEIGPGDALGIGICALLSGAESYVGLDKIPFALRANNISLFRELYSMFRARVPIPESSTSGIHPKLDSYAFPSQILTDEILQRSLAPERLRSIEAALAGGLQSADSPIRYIAPWDSDSIIESRTIDFILSQAVMEHVDEIDAAYLAMRRWLRPGAVMSHQIDYSCHGITRDWYGHWLVSQPAWLLARGRRKYFINRCTHSSQVASMQRAGFQIVSTICTSDENTSLSEDIRIRHESGDLHLRGALIIAVPEEQ